MAQTNTREMRQALAEVLRAHEIDNLALEMELADAAMRTARGQVARRGPEEIRSAIQAAADRSLGYHGPDLSSWAEEIRDTVMTVCVLWNLNPPLTTGRQADWIVGARELVDACGELRPPDVLHAVRERFEKYMNANGGLPPFSVSGPRSLVRSCASMAGEMRQARQEAPLEEDIQVDATGGMFL